MRTVDFSTILHEAAQVCGLDRHNLSDNDFSMIRDFASQRLAMVWESEHWSPLIRTAAAVTNSAISLADNNGGSIRFTVTKAPASAGETILVTGVDAEADAPVNGSHTVASVTGTAPNWVITTTTASATAFSQAQDGAWLRRDSDPIMIDMEGGFDPEIGEILEIWSTDPRLNTTSNALLGTIISIDGRAYATCKTGGKVYVEYRVQAPKLFGDAWDGSTSYSVGSQVWYDSEGQTADYTPIPGKRMVGNFYTCTASTVAGQSPVSSPAKWSKIEIPYIFSRYLCRAIHADYLRSEQQYDQAASVEQDAEAMRMLEVDKQIRQSGQIQRLRMQFTY